MMPNSFENRGIVSSEYDDTRSPRLSPRGGELHGSSHSQQQFYSGQEPNWTSNHDTRSKRPTFALDMDALSQSLSKLRDEDNFANPVDSGRLTTVTAHSATTYSDNISRSTAEWSVLHDQNADRVYPSSSPLSTGEQQQQQQQQQQQPPYYPQSSYRSSLPSEDRPSLYEQPPQQQTEQNRIMYDSRHFFAGRAGNDALSFATAGSQKPDDSAVGRGEGNVVGPAFVRGTPTTLLAKAAEVAATRYAPPQGPSSFSFSSGNREHHNQHQAQQRQQQEYGVLSGVVQAGGSDSAVGVTGNGGFHQQGRDVSGVAYSDGAAAVQDDRMQQYLLEQHQQHQQHLHHRLRQQQQQQQQQQMQRPQPYYEDRIGARAASGMEGSMVMLPQQQQQQLQQLHLDEASGAAPDDHVYRVQFKHHVRNYLRGPYFPSNVQVQVGDYVKMEADRGEDLGVVIEIVTMQDLLRKAAQRSAVGDEEYAIIQTGRILRLSSMYEKQQMPQKYRDEEEVVAFANDLSQNIHGLQITVLDAEFQYDRHKLTVYYSTDRRIDFRELVRDLFGRYKARIWMKQIFESQEQQERYKQQQLLHQQQRSSRFARNNNNHNNGGGGGARRAVGGVAFGSGYSVDPYGGRSTGGYGGVGAGSGGGYGGVGGGMGSGFSPRGGGVDAAPSQSMSSRSSYMNPYSSNIVSPRSIGSGGSGSIGGNNNFINSYSNNNINNNLLSPRSIGSGESGGGSAGSGGSARYGQQTSSMDSYNPSAAASAGGAGMHSPPQQLRGDRLVTGGAMTSASGAFGYQGHAATSLPMPLPRAISAVRAAAIHSLQSDADHDHDSDTFVDRYGPGSSVAGGKVPDAPSERDFLDFHRQQQHHQQQLQGGVSARDAGADVSLNQWSTVSYQPSNHHQQHLLVDPSLNVGVGDHRGPGGTAGGSRFASRGMSGSAGLPFFPTSSGSGGSAGGMFFGDSNSSLTSAGGTHGGGGGGQGGGRPGEGGVNHNGFDSWSTPRSLGDSAADNNIAGADSSDILVGFDAAGDNSNNLRTSAPAWSTISSGSISPALSPRLGMAPIPSPPHLNHLQHNHQQQHVAEHGERVGYSDSMYGGHRSGIGGGAREEDGVNENSNTHIRPNGGGPVVPLLPLGRSTSAGSSSGETRSVYSLGSTMLQQGDGGSGHGSV